MLIMPKGQNFHMGLANGGGLAVRLVSPPEVWTHLRPSFSLRSALPAGKSRKIEQSHRSG